MNIKENLDKFMADKAGKMNIAAILGEVLVFVVLVPIINSLVSGLVNSSTGTAATVYGLTDVFLAIGFFYLLYKQIKGGK